MRIDLGTLGPPLLSSIGDGTDTLCGAAADWHPSTCCCVCCRAYKAENRLIESNGRLIDRNVVMTLVQMSCNR